MSDIRRARNSAAKWLPAKWLPAKWLPAGRLTRVTLIVAALAVVSALGAGLTLFLARGGGIGGAAEALARPTACPSAASAPCAPTAAPTTAPAAAVPYSHSWYIDGSVDSREGMASLGAGDARWLARQAAGSACPDDFLTVLDFGHPTRKFAGGASPLDDYAMSVFRPRAEGVAMMVTYREVEGLAEAYLDAWVAAAADSGSGGCPRLRLALGTSNYAECREPAAPCDVYTAGRYWDVVAHDVADYAAAKGYGDRVTAVWPADDIEASWDPWATTAQFLTGVRDQERTYAAPHARLVDYGDAQVGACSVVVGGCQQPWTPANVYDAAWGVGWAVPLPEAYNADTAGLWEGVAASQGAENPMAFLGVMTECAGPDPLPAGPCRPQGIGVTGTGACEWSPAVAFAQMRATAAGQSLAHATNIQWPDQPSGAPSGDQTNANPPNGQNAAACG